MTWIVVSATAEPCWRISVYIMLRKWETCDQMITWRNTSTWMKVLILGFKIPVTTLGKLRPKAVCWENTYSIAKHGKDKENGKTETGSSQPRWVDFTELRSGFKVDSTAMTFALLSISIICVIHPPAEMKSIRSTPFQTSEKGISVFVTCIICFYELIKCMAVR